MGHTCNCSNDANLEDEVKIIKNSDNYNSRPSSIVK